MASCTSNANRLAPNAKYMNLRGIVAVSGRPGLFKLVGQNKSGYVLESLDEQKLKIVANIAKTYKDSKDKTLDLLCNKVKDRGVQFDMVYFQPANDKSPEHQE